MNCFQVTHVTDKAMFSGKCMWPSEHCTLCALSLSLFQQVHLEHISPLNLEMSGMCFGKALCLLHYNVSCIFIQAIREHFAYDARLYKRPS